MRRLLLVLALVVAGLLVLNGCVAETQGTSETEEQSENQQETQQEISEASTIYEAVSELFDADIDAEISAKVVGIVTYVYYDKYFYGSEEGATAVLIQDEDGKAGLKLGLKEGVPDPKEGDLIVAYGTILKFKNDDYEKADVSTFKMKEAEVTVVESGKSIVPSDITDEFFAMENNYKFSVLVHATGTITDDPYIKYYDDGTPGYGWFFMETSYSDGKVATINVFFPPRVVDWLAENKDSLKKGTRVYITGIWDKYKGAWEIIPVNTEDLKILNE